MSPLDHAESSPSSESVHAADLHELIANGPVPGTQKRAAQFTTTHWSIVVEARGESTSALDDRALLVARGSDDLDKAARVQACAAHQSAVDIGLAH